MTRHARNCTAGAVYTYHEKKKDAQSSGYGTNTQRIGKDSVKNFDCCSLSLQPCRNPVITKDGYLFDKEVILQYIINKKQEYHRKLKEYNKQLKKDEVIVIYIPNAVKQCSRNSAVERRERMREQALTHKDELAELAEAEKASKLNNFLKAEKNIVSKPIDAFKKDQEASTSVSNMANGNNSKLPSFWVPSKTPQAKRETFKKPECAIVCPISGKPLKSKDLIDVKFTLVKDPDDKKSIIVKENRYMCAVTHDILSNSVPCAVLKPTGDVVTMECVEKIIKKDWIHPLTSQKLTEKDIIPMQRGGTGYSQTNANLEGKHERPVLQA